MGRCFITISLFYPFVYLPDRTLTDEELLQIIDFNYTRDYAVSQGTAAQEARKEWEEKEESQNMLQKTPALMGRCFYYFIILSFCQYLYLFLNPDLFEWTHDFLISHEIKVRELICSDCRTP